MARITLRQLLDHAGEGGYGAMTAVFRKVATEGRREFDPRKFLKPAMDSLRALCRERFEQFGTAGNASRIKVLPLSEMARRYRSGALDPQIGAVAAAAA